MRTSAIAATALLVCWQTAPVTVATDSAGKIRLSLGYGSGQFEERRLSCSNEVLDAWPREFRTTGASLEAWPTSTVRLSAFGGRYAEGGSNSTILGFQVALEGRRAGIGVGVMRAAFVEDFFGEAAPSAYLRLGNIDRAHFRADLLAPTPIAGTTGDILRVGVGFNAGRRRAVGGMLGLSVGPYSDESHVGGLFGELYVPVAAQLDLMVAGSWRPSAELADYGIGVAARVHLAR